MNLNCPVTDCTFSKTIGQNASEAEAVEITVQFQRHLKTHSIDELVITVFRLLMELQQFK